MWRYPNAFVYRFVKKLVDLSKSFKSVFYLDFDSSEEAAESSTS